MNVPDALTCGFTAASIGLFVIEVKQERYGPARATALLIGFLVFLLLL